MKPKKLEGRRGPIKYEFALTEKAKNELWDEIAMADDEPLTYVFFARGNTFVFLNLHDWNAIAKKHNARLLKKWVLDDAEREYLRNVLRPFKKKLIGVAKYHSGEFVKDPYEYIIAHIRDFNLEFPAFPEGKMYRGMEERKKYTWEELGL